MSTPAPQVTRAPMVPACWLCRGPGRLLYDDCRDLEYFVPGSAVFARCESCGFVFIDPVPTAAELEALYPESYNNFHAPQGVGAFLLRRYHAHQAARCMRYLHPGARFLEVGCGTGALLERLRGQGVDVRGIDLSPAACRLARARGLDVFQGTVEDYETTERFALIFLSHVIEHVPDPVGTIARLTSLLEPGGVIYLETPNVGALDARVWGQEWGLIHYPRHLSLFDRVTIRRLLGSAGLEVLEVTSEINSCGWALSIQGALRRRGWDRSRAPRSRYYPLLLLGCLPLNLVDLCFGGTAFMSAVARRPA